MAKTRAQRKAEQRRRQQQAQRPSGAPAPTVSDTDAQQQTQVPESADAIEAELAERGADLDALRESPDQVDGEAAAAPAAPAPSRADVGRPSEAEVAEEPADKISRRARRQAEREQRERAKESERRRAPREQPVERQRGAVAGFIASCAAELRRVQWPDRETLIQATAITLIFIVVMAAYLGVLDTVFNFVVQSVL